MQQISEYILAVSNDQWYVIWIIVLVVSYLTYLITRYIVLKAISNLFKKTSTQLDDILIEKGLFNRLSYAVPLILIYNLSNLLPDYVIIGRAILGLIAAVLLLSVNSFISATSDAANHFLCWHDFTSIYFYLAKTRLWRNKYRLYLR